MLTEADVRRIALSMPEAYEAAHFDATSFRVNKKIYCTFGVGTGRAMLKFDPEDQRNLIDDDPASISAVPGYWGQKGMSYVIFGSVDEARLTTLMRLAWATVAPKRLLR